MKVPAQFEYLATCFHSGSDREHATMGDWVRSTVRSFLTPEDRKIVKQYLDELLEGAATDDDLQKLWRGRDSDIWLRTGADVRRFLTMIRDASG
jgi:hypothetical protein